MNRLICPVQAEDELEQFQTGEKGGSYMHCRMISNSFLQVGNGELLCP
jgi:hypothetical protein